MLDSTSSNDLELKENKLVLIENCAKIYLGQTQESWNFLPTSLSYILNISVKDKILKDILRHL